MAVPPYEALSREALLWRDSILKTAGSADIDRLLEYFFKRGMLDCLPEEVRDLPTALYRARLALGVFNAGRLDDAVRKLRLANSNS